MFGKRFFHSLCIYDENLNADVSICFARPIHSRLVAWGGMGWYGVVRGGKGWYGVVWMA